MPSANDYHYLTQWSEKDQTFLGHCYEFPSVASHGANHDEAKENILKVVLTEIQISKDMGIPLPEVSTDTESEMRAVFEERFNAFPKGEGGSG